MDEHVAGTVVIQSLEFLPPLPKLSREGQIVHVSSQAPLHLQYLPLEKFLGHVLDIPWPSAAELTSAELQ